MPYTAEQTAERLAFAIQKRSEESAITRFQLSLKGIGEMSEKEIVDKVFLSSLSSELLNKSWCMFQVSSTSYSFIQLDSAQKFRKLSGQRLSTLIDS
ncbi:hypothetical protein HJP15_05565 [Pseudoalteromonas sp. NEC-BIFX-2020_002]|uniref:hypothetical protein n=2 Tax=unclassified Pseudoalteromonas TaxID=194690 RepID=UPI001476FB70|nr:hypothetical protein [Pseudoalteromonas sp. NEC-BIFX-2020_002]NNG42412.1 hypothetical protein [Pseudoalteromonas sp. NEC-BIFX-2020_002]